jgi:hypothetical protein
MEFEPEAPIKEEDRLLAQTKMLTLQPANPFLKPVDAPGPVRPTEIHANITPDSENTANGAELIRPSVGSTTKHSTSTKNTPALLAGVVVICMVLGIVTGFSYFMFS